MDYAMPRASDAPDFSIENHSVPCKTNLLGVKGCGEAGCAGALPSVMNAVVDALSEVGVTHIDMPVTPEKVWRGVEGPSSLAAGRNSCPPPPAARALPFSPDAEKKTNPATPR